MSYYNHIEMFVNKITIITYSAGCDTISKKRTSPSFWPKLNTYHYNHFTFEGRFLK
jgi:hypothetical protein